jgi:hypothetical protein
MQHSHQSQPRFWSWEGWSLIETRQRSTWLSIPVTNLFLCRRDTDRFLRQCWSFQSRDVWCFNQPPMGDHHWLGSPYDLLSGHRPQALLIQTIKKTTLYSKIKSQGWSNFPKTSENDNHKDQTNNFSDFPREQKQTIANQQFQPVSMRIACKCWCKEHARHRGDAFPPDSKGAFGKVGVPVAWPATSVQCISNQLQNIKLRKSKNNK